jgi:hypothetical protein
MRRRNHLLAFFCLTLVVLGCGDTPHVILRDAITTWNELADTVAEIPDDPERAEEVAAELVKTRLDVLSKKWKDSIQKRVSTFQKADKDQRVGVNAAVADLKDNAEFTMGRLASQFGGSAKNAAMVEGRLRRIIAKVHAARPGQGTPNLEKCLSLVSGFNITLPTDQKKFPEVNKYQGSWTFSGFGAGGGGFRGGGFPGGMPGGGAPGMPPPGMQPGAGPPGMRPPGQ